MKKGRLLDKIVTWGIRVAPLIIGNQTVYPEVLINWAKSWNINGVPRINTNNVEIPDLGNSYLDARNYLDLANSIVHQNIVKDAVCRDYAKATLEVYKRSIEQAGKKDLINCVQSAFDGEHNWLGIREGREWVKYETMHKTPELTPKTVRAYSSSTEDQKTFLNGNPNRKVQVVCPAGNNCYPNLDAYFEKGGNLAILTRAYLGD